MLLKVTHENEHRQWWKFVHYLPLGGKLFPVFNRERLTWISQKETSCWLNGSWDNVRSLLTWWDDGGEKKTKYWAQHQSGLECRWHEANITSKCQRAIFRAFQQLITIIMFNPPCNVKCEAKIFFLAAFRLRRMARVSLVLWQMKLSWKLECSSSYIKLDLSQSKKSCEVSQMIFYSQPKSDNSDDNNNSNRPTSGEEKCSSFNHLCC